jgi:hypothetical protein
MGCSFAVSACDCIDSVDPKFSPHEPDSLASRFDQRVVMFYWAFSLIVFLQGKASMWDLLRSRAFGNGGLFVASFFFSKPSHGPMNPSIVFA